jgi:hypothetical protein
LLSLAFGVGYLHAMPEETPSRRDIGEVLRAHDQELLKLPNVVGVYVGLLADEKTPCLKVMLSRETPATERALPKSLEGYPVVAEVTGEVRPLR